MKCPPGQGLVMQLMENQIRSFLDHGESERNLASRTLKAYESDLLQFHNHIASQEIGEITPEILDEYVEGLTTTGDYKGTSIRRKVAAIKVFFRYLEDTGYVEHSPAKMLTIRKPVEKTQPRVLTSEEMRALLMAPKAEIARLEPDRERSRGSSNRYFCAVRDDVILEMLFATGIRIGELVEINVEDVDFEAGMISIIGRGERPREVLVTSGIVRDAIARYLALRQERTGETAALFIGRLDTRLTIYSIENIFKKYAKLAGIKRNVTPHSIRHTTAAMLVAGGRDVNEVKEILGHASVLSTQVYQRMRVRSKSKVDRSDKRDHRDQLMAETGEPRLAIRRK